MLTPQLISSLGSSANQWTGFYMITASGMKGLIIVNHRLSALGAYLKTKALGWSLFRTGGLIGPESLIQKNIYK